jgi:DNA modification methylase
VTAAVPAPGSVRIHHGDNLAVSAGYPDGAFTLVYLDPPFNTGRSRSRSVDLARRPAAVTSPPASVSQENRDADATLSARGRGAVLHQDADLLRNEQDAAGSGSESGPLPGTVSGFRGQAYERLRGDLRVWDDRFDDYWGFLEPRLTEAWRLLAPDGTLYLHLDYREAHYAKVLLDALFGREHFLNELIWAYDYGAKSRRRWPTKHDTILVYVKDPQAYWFDSDAVDREPYMAPGLVTAEKAARGKLPTDVWWHTIVPTSGREKTGYPTQKPEGILRRIVQASSRPGDAVLDFFAGSGTTGAVASALGRHAVLVDDNPDAVAVMQQRMPHATLVRDEAAFLG